MADRPNILFFFSDQQRWDTVGCYGQPLPVTPNLDHMAAEGVRFELAFTCQPVCGPARASLQTGKYALETGCYRNGIALPQDATTIARLASAAGYETAYIGKWHLASTQDMGDLDFDCRQDAVPPERRGGWDDYWLASDVLEYTSHGYDGYMHDGEMNKVDFKGYRVDCQTDFVLDYLRNHRGGDKPFFLFASYIEPHHQNDHKCYEGPDGSKEKWKDYHVPGDLEGTGGDWRENYPDYLGQCNSLDENLGRVRTCLDELGLADDTLIIYTSDHGSHFRTRNGEYKRAPHDGCIRVPMVACGPGFRGGKVAGSIASLIDIPPTLLTAAGIDVPEAMGGRPLQQLASGKAPADWPEEAFLQISESGVARALRTRKWTYAVHAPDLDGWNDRDSETYVEQYLYDNEADPNQRNNLVADDVYKDTRAELAVTLKRRMVDADEAEPVILPVDKEAS